MINAKLDGSKYRVSALWIDAPKLKQDLMKIADAIDTSFASIKPLDVASSLRHAFESLSEHVYHHCRDQRSDGGSATAANPRFDQFEKLLANNDRDRMSELRTPFQTTGNLAAHRKVVTDKDVRNGFNNLVEYLEAWITTFAPEAQRKTSAYKDPHLDVIIAYQQRAKQRFDGLMGSNVPAGCYINRQAMFLLRESDDTPLDDPFDELDRIKCRKDQRDCALPDKPATRELLEKLPHSLLLAHAGMGKSVEAAAMAVRLTATDDGTQLSCCVTIECRYLDQKNPSIEAAFGLSRTVCPPFDVFAALAVWRRYLVLDGFDERRCDEDDFRKAVEAFEKQCPGIRVLITSRNVGAIEKAFDETWQAYDLLGLDYGGIESYLRARWGGQESLLTDFKLLWDQLDRYDNVRDLLCRPFFLSAFAGPSGPTVPIKDIGRRQLAESFVRRLLNRQWEKAEATLAPEAYDRLLAGLASYAFGIAVEQPHEPKGLVKLADMDMLLRQDDKQFKQTEIRDYLAACHLLRNPLNHKFDLLGRMEDQRRFELHGWLLELLNAKDGAWAPAERARVLKRLWADDPVLVSLGLFSEYELNSLELPQCPWDPYQVGLLRIMRGEQASTIEQTREIRDLRLNSAGERLLHRLKDEDLPYLIRAVPGRRAVTRLQAAWTEAADPWAELMPPLAAIARECIYARPSPGLLGFAFGVPESPVDENEATRMAQLAIDQRAETEVLVRLLLLLADLRTRAGADPKAQQTVYEAIRMVRPMLFAQQLSIKQLHRLRASETKHREGGKGASFDVKFRQRIGRMIYDGNHLQPDPGAIRMLPLIIELADLPYFGEKSARRALAQQLWDLVVLAKDVGSVPPVTLVRALRTRIAAPESLARNDWLSRWIHHWFARVDPYETVALQACRIRFAAEPPGLVDAKGWLQARDAIALKRACQGVAASSEAPAHSYTAEQMRHWADTATVAELIRLLELRLIDRISGDAFKRAVHHLERDSRPQHWWQLVREGALTQKDIDVTVSGLKRMVLSDPVAYELLQGVGWCGEPPSDKVVAAATQCDGCPLETRARLVSRGKVSVLACWRAERAVLDDVKSRIAAGEHILYPDGSPISARRGAFLPGFFTLIFDNTAGGFRFTHPAFDHQLDLLDDECRERIAGTAKRLDWRCGELVMGFLWVRPASKDKDRFTVSWHRRGFRGIGCVVQDDGELQFDAPSKLLESRDAQAELFDPFQQASGS